MPIRKDPILMRLVYLDCFSGISGDMLLAALLDLGAPRDALLEGLASLDLPAARLEIGEVRRRGFRACNIHVRHDQAQAHRHLADIVRLLRRSRLTHAQQSLAERLFRRLAEAEARVHGTSVDRVHFHEVGAVDSIYDIVGTAIAWDWLRPDRVVASPVPVGCGTVNIAHGRVQLPAPATAELLRGVPIEATTIEAELTTPTGAVFLAELVDAFGTLPAMTVEQVGYGAGDRDLEEQANVLRVWVGRDQSADETETDWVDVLETQIDDQPAEQLAYLMQRLLERGALDVFFTPILMKKNRPGTAITVLAPPGRRAEIESTLFAQSTTTGIRVGRSFRRKLRREAGTVETNWGSIEGKWVTLPEGGRRFVPEFDACRRVADERRVPLPDVYQAAIAASLSSGP